MVVNSRPQIRTNTIWRRRKCTACAGIFTTLEGTDLGAAVSFAAGRSGRLEPFSRDKLFVSIYESCRHLPDATAVATSLTQTVAAKALRQQKDGVLHAQDLIAVALTALKHFDKTAATIYAAYHPTVRA